MRSEILSTTSLSEYTNLVALIPFGAFEQHGPRLPLATDSMIATALAERVEKEIPDKIMLFPTLWFGDSLEHEGFAGTLSVSAIKLMSMLEDLFTWLQASGFSRAILYNAHGGNKHLAATFCEEFSRKHSLKIKSMYACTSNVRALSKELFGVSESHGGSTEASLLSALRPDLGLVDGTWPHVQRAVTSLLPLTIVKNISETGILEQSDQVILNTVHGETLAECMAEELKKTCNFLFDALL